MKWFDNWFYKKIKWVLNEMDSPSPEYKVNEMQASKISVSREIPNASKSIRFTIFPANGGYVIEHSNHDRFKDQTSGPTLTVVNKSEDIGEMIAKIITMEALKS